MDAMPAARRFHGTYAAEPAQVGHARRALAQALDGHPFCEDAALIASEFATNAVLHSASGNGGKFTVCVEIHKDYLWIGVGDAGGPWNRVRYGDGRPHGFDVVDAVTGASNWGIEGDATGRIAWARIVTLS
jgi:anti-sigma regulatory factor (Ser/Thr protein kinase)